MKGIQSETVLCGSTTDLGRSQELNSKQKAGKNQAERHFKGFSSLDKKGLALEPLGGGIAWVIRFWGA